MRITTTRHLLRQVLNQIRTADDLSKEIVRLQTTEGFIALEFVAEPDGSIAVDWTEYELVPIGDSWRSVGAWFDKSRTRDGFPPAELWEDLSCLTILKAHVSRLQDEYCKLLKEEKIL